MDKALPFAISAFIVGFGFWIFIASEIYCAHLLEYHRPISDRDRARECSRTQIAISSMSEPEPTPELPDDTPIREVHFPTCIKDALFGSGLKTVGEVRETPDEALLSLPDFGHASIAHLRETLGLPSIAGVRPTGKKTT